MLKREDRKRFRIKSWGVETQKRAVRYGKAKAIRFTKPHGNTYTINLVANECNVVVSWKTYWKTLIQSKHVQRNFNGQIWLYSEAALRGVL